ncbi:MAG: DEAD/DEAH box helicase [Microgenomates group bacterium]
MKYISDIIPIGEIDSWIGKKVLISAQTGTGKSYWTKNTLYEWCLRNNKRILILSNRTLLKNQIIEDIREKADFITVRNYQSIENGILETREDLQYLFSKFDAIVCDEFHYIYADSDFNRNTDLLLDIFETDYPNKIFVFISATPEMSLFAGNKFDFIYTAEKDYSYISSLSFYYKDRTPEAILQNLEHEEKAIYFSSSAAEALALSQSFDDAVFICAESNKEFYKYSDQNTEKEIIENQYFSARILCTTKVMENGISICDESVKTIILDFINPITLIQALGRKRILNENDKIRVFVKNHHNRELNYHLGSLKMKLDIAEEREQFGEEEFQQKHRKAMFDDIVDNDFNINKAKYYNYSYQVDFLEKVMKEYNGYKKYLVEYFQAKWEDDEENADKQFEIIGLAEFLLSKKNIKMFKSEQETFKDKFFYLIFSPKNTNYRNRGINSINSIIAEDGIPLELISEQETKGEDRHKRWWMIVDKDSPNTK